jgi:hypothetical protein
MVRRAFLPFLILFLLASCGFSRTSSHFTPGDRSVSAAIPRKVAVRLCETSPSVRFDVMNALAENLSSMGIDVANVGNVADTQLVCGGETLPEAVRKSLRDNLGIEGLFVGVFEQRRVEPMLLTRFELRLIDIPSGRLVWSTNVKRDDLAATANARTAAAKAAKTAVESFQKDGFRKSNVDDKRRREEKREKEGLEGVPTFGGRA